MTEPPVQITRRRGQKSIRIRVKNGRILVSAPYTCRKSEIERFVVSQNTWINKQVTKHQELQHFVNNALESGKWLVDGKWVVYDVIPDNRSSINYNGQKVEFFYDGDASNPPKEELAVIFKKWSKKILTERFWNTAKRVGLKPIKVSIRSQQSKWGSCSAKKTISLNWRLIKCPPEIQEYIFIHELCHLEQMNHSVKFWNLVDSHYPERKKAEQWLRNNSRAMFLD